MTNIEKLIAEVATGRQEYITDGYSMSIGEIVSNYKEGEIDINPDFQRKFRWSVHQRSRLIESILIGVPLPSIFVYQNDKGVWEVVDGVQRLSTILEFMGELKDVDGNKLPQSTLVKTKMLPSSDCEKNPLPSFAIRRIELSLTHRRPTAPPTKTTWPTAPDKIANSLDFLPPRWTK